MTHGIEILKERLEILNNSYSKYVSNGNVEIGSGVAKNNRKIAKEIEEALNILTINQLKPKRMDWEDKVKLIKLGNAKGNNPESMSEFKNYCLEKASIFDLQAWDMFCNLIEILPTEMEKDILFWEKLWPDLKMVDGGKLGFRPAMRMCVIQGVCKDVLRFSPK